MNKLSSKALLGIALVLSLMTSTLVYNYLKGVTTRTVKDGLPVVVAKVDIPPKTAVTPEMIQTVTIPPEYMAPGVISDQQMVVGVLTRERVVAGEQITDRRLVLQGKNAGFSGIIPKDKRAVTVAVSEVTGVNGFLRPGDFVDVIATFDQNAAGDNVSHMVLQNILVLASNRETEEVIAMTAEKDKKDVIKTSTVTLAVTPEEAATLALSEEKGKIRLALRPYAPVHSIAITNAVTPKDLVGEHTAPHKGTVSQPAPSGSEKAPSRPAAGGGIVTIRGTRMETVPVN